MAPRSDSKALLLGISGVSSCGKTTLARLLRDIYPKVFVLHLDDFYFKDDAIPVRPADGLADWDCLESLDLPALTSTLAYIRANGSTPREFVSKEDRNSVGEVTVDKTLVEDLKWQASKWMFADGPPIAIIDGFLLYSEEMKAVRDLFDVKLFLRTDYWTAKTRREARSGYVTIEGFWEDPPGYVDKVVWPNYVKDHSFLFRDRDVEGEYDEATMRRLGIEGIPHEARESMTTCLQWAYDILNDALEEVITPRD